jgi:protein-S-isoprenylcysteine O-methyltransferase Ste14
MPGYHVAFWFAAAVTSVLLTLGVIAMSVWGNERQKAYEGGLAAVLTLALGGMFTLALTCLGLRRDFVRPLTAVVTMALLFMLVLALLAIRLGGGAGPPHGSDGSRVKP